MPKVMISQPMGGLTDEEILLTKQQATTYLTARGYSVVNSYLAEDNLSPLYMLGTSLQIMSKCDAVYFCNGWEKARGCRIEHEAAKAYGLQILYEERDHI